MAKKRKFPDMDIGYLRERVDYNPSTGKLYWKHSERMRPNWNGRHAGKEAFNSLQTLGFLQGNIDWEKHLAHRVAWALHYGTWPSGDVKHRNGDRTDNRIANLYMAGGVAEEADEVWRMLA